MLNRLLDRLKIPLGSPNPTPPILLLSSGVNNQPRPLTACWLEDQAFRAVRSRMTVSHLPAICAEPNPEDFWVTPL
jgi:hypothetical protein